MKNKNALGKASLVLAFIAVAYYIVITVLGLFPIVNNVIYGKGSGSSKKDACQNAAHDALEKLARVENEDE